MFKFLRKYNKWILAIGGTLLMIVFLIPQALEGLAQQAGIGRAVRATVGPDGEERVLTREWNEYRQQMDIIRRLQQRQPVLPWIGNIQNTEHWFLLVREAEQAGLVSSPRALNIPPQQLAELEAIAGVTGPIVPLTFARVDGVQRLLQLYRDAGHVSDRRMRNFAARAFHKVDTQMVVLRASEDRVDFAPTDSDIREQYERFREIEPGEGEMGFGYRLPHRVKLEWLSVPVADVREAVKASEAMDGVALRRHWRRNPEGIFPEVEPGPIPDQVREHLLDQLVEEKLNNISRYANDVLRASRRALDERRGIYILPDDWPEQRQSLSELGRLIQDRYDIGLPEYKAIGDRWIAVDELDELNGISNATTELFGRRPLGLRELVPAARELDGSNLVQIQQGVAGPILTGPDGSVYVFRITDVDAARPPRELDEVRDQVVRDLKRLAHFRELQERRSQIEGLAIAQGMLGLSIEFDTEMHVAEVTLSDELMYIAQIQAGRSPGLTPPPLPMIGEHRSTSETIIDRARELPQDKPMREISVEDRTFVIDVDDHLSLIAVRVLRQEPLTEEEYRDLASFNIIRTLLLNEELGGDEQIRNTFSFETLAKRHNFSIHDPEDLDIDEDLERELEEGIARR